ncbi:MAG: ArnT family glycosyltransferase, partial [Planctomycetia bacterium]
FGVSWIGGRGLTMHEAVLPQSAREMALAGEWIVPTSGGRPWLERPPLPQWLTIAVAAVVGRCDEEWIVRLPPAFMAMGTVLLTAFVAGRWFGRSIGVLSGLCLATMVEFTRYAWLAEQDIFLTTLVAGAVSFFAWNEWQANGAPRVAPPPDGWRATLFGPRTLGVLAFFVALGTTNLVKGLIFGSAMVLLPVLGWLALDVARGRWKVYAWFWGWLAFALVAAAWPVAAYNRHPDVVELWLFDLVGRLNGDYTAINEPFWYYAVNLPWEMLPWTAPAFLALWITRRTVLKDAAGPTRFVWLWALLPPLVFSLARGKHHHYMLHVLPAWSILGAIGLIECRRRWEACRFADARNRFVRCFAATATPAARIQAAGVLFGVTAAAFTGGYVVAAKYVDHGRHDVVFLKDVRRLAPDSAPLVLNADTQSMDVFRIAFYQRSDAVVVHNLTYLRDRRYAGRELYVVTRALDEPALAALGRFEKVAQSPKSRRERSPADRLTLYRLETAPATLAASPDALRVSPMQAMDRAAGPFLGRPF